eukprot:TRINITY_DN1204_c0_g1_i4.p1 TRINITY_DN1204_c0_g1~~TRINITY_DN1204_c0_g1_i4.p1  ORF type:complete len:137 (-),score=38.52 TRINITY_DN1204_c0_g1_i4:132-542(-)
MADENYEGEAPTGKSDNDYTSEVKDRERGVQQKLLQSDFAGALEIALQDPPYGAGQSVKDHNAKVVVNVLTTSKEKDVDAAVAKLSDDNLDVLMKYVYKGLESGENSNILLKWHESVFAKTGLGSIVRTLAERKAV